MISNLIRWSNGDWGYDVYEDGYYIGRVERIYEPIDGWKLTCQEDRYASTIDATFLMLKQCTHEHVDKSSDDGITFGS